jgi:hypothetical protein
METVQAASYFLSHEFSLSIFFISIFILDVSPNCNLPFYSYSYVVVALYSYSLQPKREGTKPNNFPFLTCLEGSTKLVCLLQNPNFSLDKDLVIISDIMSQVWIFSITKNFISIASRIY